MNLLRRLLSRADAHDSTDGWFRIETGFYPISAFFILPMTETTELKTYMCLLCGFIYDEVKGWPQDGIAPETRWDDIPMNWTCPDCGARKDDFEMIAI